MSEPLDIIETTSELLRGEGKAGIIMHQESGDCYFQYYGHEQDVIDVIMNIMILDKHIHLMVRDALERCDEYNSEKN